MAGRVVWVAPKVHTGSNAEAMCLLCLCCSKWTGVTKEQAGLEPKALSRKGSKAAEVAETAQGPVWAPVCLCLLTRVPVVQPLLSWLVQAYDRLDRLLPPSFDQLLDVEALGGLTPLFRSQIVQITEEVPLPIPGA